MENFWQNKNSINIQKDENIKKEFISEKEKNHLNLRKKKLYEIIASKRKIDLSTKSNDEIKKEYSLDYEEIDNIPVKYKVDISKFIENVRRYLLYLYIVQFIIIKRLLEIIRYIFKFVWNLHHKLLLEKQ